MFNGLLSFPVTPYARDGEVGLRELTARKERVLTAGLAALHDPVSAGN